MKAPTQSLQKHFVLLGIASCTLFIALVGLALRYQYQQTVDTGHRLASARAAVMAEQTERIFDAAAQRLLAVQLELGHLQELGALNSSAARTVLLRQLQGQDYLADIWLLDREGRILFDSQPGTEGVNLADRGFFTAHTEALDTQLFIDVPVLSRRTGQWQLSVSRSWRKANGDLQGVVVASIDPAHFDTAWQWQGVLGQESITILNSDGVLLMRSPFSARSIGANFKSQPLFTEYLARAPKGTFVATSPVDGIQRFFGYARSDGQRGLVFIAGLPFADVMKPWWQLLWIVLGVSCFGLTTVLWLFHRLRSTLLATEQAQAQARLSDVALRAVSQGVLISDAQRNTVMVNQAFEDLTGYSAAEVIGQSCKILQGPLTDARINLTMQAALNNGQPVNTEILNYRKDGSTFWNELTISPVLDAQGTLTHFVGIQNDVTLRKLQQQMLRLTEQVFDQAREGITVTDAEGGILRVNRAFERITGYSEAEVKGKNTRLLASGLQDRRFYDAMWQSITENGVWVGEISNRHKDGTVYPEWLTISVIRDDQGRVCNYLGSFSDLSEVRAAENRVKHLIHFDPLTGLPNRLLLEDRTAHAISMVQRAKDPLCMMLISLDHFKALTDTQGHKTADSLIVEVARRLTDAVREQDTVSHHSGKEFTLILPSTSADGAAHLAAELLWKISQAYDLANQQISVTASIGVAVFPENGHDFDTLFKSAQIALHRAQTGGRDNFKFYNDGMYQEVLAREQVTRALRHAAQRGEFQVVYQPLGDLQTGKISGMEALLRWHHPELGAVPPVVFIPIAEETGLIRGIGEWVLRQVCTDLRRWIDEGLNPPHIAVNVSPIQFHDPAFVELLQLALADHGVQPHHIHLEVTESALMEDAQRCEEILYTLKKLGFFLSLDDFGTGYSSLSYLKRYPFDKVKIDQSFVRDISSNHADSVIVKIIISMAHGLGMKVIAEGVETEAQCEFMRSNVCDEIQGYFFSRPVNAATLQSLLLDGKSLPAHLLRFRTKARTLLLVDDEPNVLAALKRIFRRDGHTILTASSGAAGLNVLAEHKVDVIISDQRMPEMTGVEFLRQAKIKHPDTVRIVLSGYTELQSVTAAINEGAIYRFLTKPWDDDQLREQITKAFEHKELLEENQQLDIKIRTTNQELVAANRQLGHVIDTTRLQIQSDSESLAIVREALDCIPTPVLGLDDEMVVVFSNSAAESCIGGVSSLLGLELAFVSPELQQAVSSTEKGQLMRVKVGELSFDAQWHSMGKTSRSLGKLLILAQAGA